MIVPTIGRVIWFYPDADTSGQAFPAFVCFVHGDRLINVAGFNDLGTSFARLSCPLWQEGDPPPTGAHARWMPYQLDKSKEQK